MSEIKDIVDIKFVQLLQHIDLDKLNTIELSTDGEDM